MALDSNIGWCHHTKNFWFGCDKIAPECAHCYIDRSLKRMGKEPWGQLYRAKVWNDVLQWERKAAKENLYYRVFTCSLSDFFHVKADPWRDEAWELIKATPHLVYLILTKRPELIDKRLPKDWGQGYPNVWLGTSVGCNQSLNKLDSLREKPAALKFISMEPLLEDISAKIDITGFDWGIVGGESGSDPEYIYDPMANWKQQLKLGGGRRYMLISWAERLWKLFDSQGKPFFFKQTTAKRPGQGEDALGHIVQEFPKAKGTWANA